MNREQVIATLRAHEPELKQAAVVRLLLFGSAVRGDRRSDSDIDLLAAFDGTPSQNLPEDSLTGRESVGEVSTPNVN